MQGLFATFAARSWIYLWVYGKLLRRKPL